MNILVTGANGQLGNEIRVAAEGSKDRYFFTDIVEVERVETILLDITEIKAVREFVKANKISIIINCAAYTNVDKAESDYDCCEVINGNAPEILAITMKEVGGLLIHISTDYVFGGAPYNTPCKEDQVGIPTGVYGLTKLHGEKRIQATGVDYLIFRTAWLYSEFGKNFVKTMLNLFKLRPQVKVVYDQVGTPTYAYDLAKTIYEIIENRTYRDKIGVYHYSNEGVCSWFDFARMISEISGNSYCEITPCRSEEFPSPVRRPAYSVLDKTKVKESFGICIPYWTDSLKKCMLKLKNEKI